MILLDINFWLAISFDSHVHHQAAIAWMQSAAQESCCFCRVTQLGFLRIATNRKMYPLEALTMNEAWRVYEELINDERVAFAEEPKDIETAWRNFTQRRSFSTKIWADAYLAAFAKTANLELITFDKGFAQFAGLRLTIFS